LLHEDGHAKLIRLLRLPHSYVKLNLEAMKRDRHDNQGLIAFIRYKPRNFLDMFLVAVAGIVFPFAYLLSVQNKVPKHLKGAYLFLLKTAIRQAISNVAHIQEENR